MNKLSIIFGKIKIEKSSGIAKIIISMKFWFFRIHIINDPSFGVVKHLSIFKYNLFSSFDDRYVFGMRNLICVRVYRRRRYD